MKTCVIVPTCRPEIMSDFLETWKEVKGMEEALWIIIEDGPKRTKFDTHDLDILHICWKDIDALPDNWIISRRSSAIRSYGFLVAWWQNIDVIITLDDDCLPENNDFLNNHLANLEVNMPISWVSSWDDLYIYPRGFPYNVRDEAKVMMSHGVWSKIPDLDAKTQVAQMMLRTKPAKNIKVIPKGCYFPMCGMNLVFKRELLPFMYFGLHGKDFPYDRFDDIWCGIILKKICDFSNWAILSGKPSIIHTKMSDVDKNLIKEAPGLVKNELFWHYVDDTDESFEKDPKFLYRSIADNLARNFKDEYFDKLSKAMHIWIQHFEPFNQKGGKNEKDSVDNAAKSLANL